MKLRTERLIMRPLVLEDTETLFSYRSDKQANKYQGWVPESLEDTGTFIKKNPTEFNIPDTWFQLGIVERETKRLIGDMGVHFLGEDQAEFGCTMDKRFQGRGFATEASVALIDCLFARFGKHRITTSVDPRNSASIALMKRLGFRQEAHFVKGLFFKGEWVDDVIFALLAQEWNKLSSDQ